MPNNRTHGIIRAFVDLSTGRKPNKVQVYFAKTLNNKRLFYLNPCDFLSFFFYRRDFRLFIADPNDSSKAIPNPGIVINRNHILVFEVCL